MPFRAIARRLEGADDGFTLIEVIAALVVFAIMSIAVVYSLLAAASTTRADRNRVVAANLLQQRLEQVRLLASQANGLNTLTLGTTTCTGSACTPTASLDGVNYTLTQTASWVAAAASADPCAAVAGGSKYAYMRVTVTGSWPSIGTQVPVRDDSLFTPALTDGGASTGSAPVKITSAAGVGVSGVTVNLTTAGGTVVSTLTTDSTGCALFTGINPGTYIPTSSAPLLVDYYGSVNHSGSAVTVTAGQQSPLSSWQLDTPARATFTSASDVAGTYPRPSSLTATIENTSVTPYFVATSASSAGTFSASNLFPFTAGDLLWSGTCADADPRQTGGSLGPNLSLSPGGNSTSATVKAHSTLVTVKKGTVAVASAHVYALHATGTGCVGMVGPDGTTYGEVYDLGNTNASGQIMTALPYGTWNFKVFQVNSAAYSGAQSGSATLSASSSTTVSNVPVTIS